MRANDRIVAFFAPAGSTRPPRPSPPTAAGSLIARCRALTVAARFLATVAPLSLMVAMAPVARAVDLALPGSLDVTPSGTAGYAIPIEVPPGTAGIRG
jgi:hypothetical protein